MKEVNGRWQRRIWSAGSGGRRARLQDVSAHATGVIASDASRPGAVPLDGKITRTALAFRGYDIANHGRSPELLAHPIFGPVVRSVLAGVSELAADVLGRPVDLASRVESSAPTTLESFPDDVAMIVAMELAQLRLLREFHGIDPAEARLTFGYSIGELSALIAGGVYTTEELLPVPLSLAPDCAELATDTTMGVLFTREPLLDEDEVRGICRRIGGEGLGLIGPSAFLSPNTALILGEGHTLDRLEALLPDELPGRVMLRRNPNRWPPLHSPIVWRKNIPNRAATAMYRVRGGTRRPRPEVVSCVTGEASYGPDNSRELMIGWTDRPQRLWDAIESTLSAGVETIIHVGPAPNLIPATFSRISNNVSKHVNNKVIRRIGSDVVATLSRHAWLAQVLPAKACLLRAPFLEHVILEDWLLTRPVT